ncbi:hypothetical protein [Corynebacterium pelargi]|uniref:Uncharacterized protein n=1 Tax=Corynebacterium pelargi TaxID=1471400 RepID=A0A410WAI9_9CORY|nr:hypothetical protein [Corynebacterium pelargi]QAU52946.1 hypothetical protein CPELA_08455 [Corynebacterium pelargi]GGG75884.1 hypothetical protein GCM10007338_11880 [Corynebacterium pelargi]
MSTPNSERKSLVFDAIFGFVGFFAFLAFIQAVLNLFQPEPRIWPALLALVLVIATVTLWRIRRRWHRPE